MLLLFSNSRICPRRIACLLEGEIFSLDIPSHRTSPITGIAPVLANSGKHCWVHWRWTCPKFLRNRPFMSGRRTIGSSAWAKSYYEQQRAKAKSPNTVVRAPAFNWIRILFRCWKDRKPYSEEVYRQALAHRHHLAVKSLTCATAVENLRRLYQNHCDYLLTQQLRCQLTRRGKL
jgi:hypothetical protein